MRQPITQELELIEFLTNTHYCGDTEVVAERIDLAQSAFFTILFSFFTTEAGKEFLMDRPLLDHLPLGNYFFLLAVILESLTLGVAVAELEARKNLKNTLNFLTKFINAGIIVPAIGLGLAAKITGIAAIGASVPYLFLAALSIGTAFSMANAIYHAVNMFAAPEGSALREAHKQALINNVIRSVLGVVMIIVIKALFVAAVSTGVGLAVFAGIGIVALVAVFVVGRVMKHSAEKRAHSAACRDQQEFKKLQQDKKVQMALKNNSTDTIKEATKAGGNEGDRLYVRDLATLLNAAQKESPEKLKQVFLTIIDAKIEDLNQKINDAQHAAEGRSRFFKAIIEIETPKHEEKVSGLKELKGIIEKLNEEKIDASDIDKISDKYPDIFQSFMHDKSDVELIFDAAKEYFAERVFPEGFEPPLRANFEF